MKLKRQTETLINQRFIKLERQALPKAWGSLVYERMAVVRNGRVPRGISTRPCMLRNMLLTRRRDQDDRSKDIKKCEDHDVETYVQGTCRG